MSLVQHCFFSFLFSFLFIVFFSFFFSNLSFKQFIIGFGGFNPDLLLFSFFFFNCLWVGLGVHVMGIF